jgi:hypothetical protein
LPASATWHRSRLPRNWLTPFVRRRTSDPPKPASDASPTRYYN